MANPCAPGISRPVTGSPAVITLDSGAITQFLLSRGVSWMFDLGAALGIVSFTMADFCAQEPPPLPTINAARVAGYFNFANTQGGQQLREDTFQILSNYFWYAQCECGNGIILPTPPPMPPPSGVTANPPALGKPTGTPCSNHSYVFETRAFDASGEIAWNPNTNFLLHAGAQWLDLQYSAGYPDLLGGGYPVTHRFDFTTTTGTVVDRHVWTQSAAVPNTQLESHQFQVPATATQWRLFSHSDTQAGRSIGMSMQGIEYCTATPPSLDEPCCPPDPQLVALINQVLRELDELLGRGTGATGYVRGLSHPGLTGVGSLSLSRAAGVLIDVTTGVPTSPVLGGNPPYQWDLGWLSMLTGDGMILERRLTRQHQVWLDPAWAVATTVGYFLNPGVTATITELQPA